MIVDVPEALRKQFRIECLKKGTTMKDVMIEFMKEYIKKGGKKKK